VKVAIVYYSLLGTSKKYALWLSEALDGDMLQFREATDRRLRHYDAIVVLSGTFGGWMPLTGYLKKHWPTLCTRRVVAVTSGSVPPEIPASQKAYEAIPEEIRNEISFFKLPCDSGLKLWLTGPFSAFQLWKHADERGWRPSRDKLTPVIAALSSPDERT
jgi:hypothetical protein